MPTVLPTATQNSPFLPQRWPKPSTVLIAPTDRGMARPSALEWPRLNTGMEDPPKVVANPSTNRVRRI